MTYKLVPVIFEKNAEIPVTEEPARLVKKPDEPVNEEPATKLEPEMLVKKPDEPVKT